MIKRLAIFFVSALAFPNILNAQVYLCAGEPGKQQYSDVPCGQNAKPYTAKEPATKFKEVKIEKPYKAENSQQASKTKACPFFSHTQLRSLRVKDDFAKGLPMKVITTRYGKPDEREQINEEKEKWKYKGEKLNREFKFKNGCLISWKHKWLGSKTYFSKYKGSSSN